jgi:predicted transcriptional regulator of viral defense system
MPGRTFVELLERAQEQYGYLTPEDARQLGVDPAQLRLMAARGTLAHLGHGLYRMPTVPVTELDPYMEAVLWTGHRGVLSHETALDLYGLCDVNPAAIHLTVPVDFRTRKPVPQTYRVHRELRDSQDVRSFEGIPIVTPERAIVGGIEQALGWQLIEQAIETARARGLVDRDAAARLGRLRPPTRRSDAGEGTHAA